METRQKTDYLSTDRTRTSSPLPMLRGNPCLVSTDVSVPSQHSERHSFSHPRLPKADQSSTSFRRRGTTPMRRSSPLVLARLAAAGCTPAAALTMWFCYAVRTGAFTYLHMGYNQWHIPIAFLVTILKATFVYHIIDICDIEDQT